MRHKPEQLPRALEKELAPAWLVAGDEPFQLGECCDLIRLRALERGFGDRKLFSVETGLDWSEVRNAAQSMGLFGGRTLIEIRLGDRRPDKAGSELLLQLLADPRPDVLLLISSSRLDRKRDLASRWVTALDRVGVLVEVWPVEAATLPRWIGQRMEARGLAAEQDAIELLAELSEGNLLACAQEIDKLALLHPGQRISAAAIQAAVGDSSRHTVFDLGDALEDAARALRILSGLRDEGIEPPVILWSLTRELRMLEALASGNGQTLRLPPQRLARAERHAVRLGLPSLGRALVLAARVDQSIKGMRPGDPWQGLEALVLRLAGQPLPEPLEEI